MTRHQQLVYRRVYSTVDESSSYTCRTQHTPQRAAAVQRTVNFARWGEGGGGGGKRTLEVADNTSNQHKLRERPSARGRGRGCLWRRGEADTPE